MRLTSKHKEAMRQVINGGDVFDYGLARLLREVQRVDKSLIKIGKAKGDYGDGSGREPYFGAILTAKGRQEVAK